MSLSWLYATRFRNLVDTRLELAQGLNLIVGDNGSGKTSLLESAYFLSSARSFRSNLSDPVIQRGADDCLVRGEISQKGRVSQIGINRFRSGDREIRVNGEACHRASELAHLLPTLLLGPESVDLLLGPPAGRRRFLNWGLFHVEPGFSELWEEANRSLRQRNRVLRDQGAPQELLTWSVQLAGQAEKLDVARQTYVQTYEPIFQSILAKLTDIENVTFEYDRGWDKDVSLASIYEKDTDSDQKRGFTQKGFQRADVRISVGGQPAVKICSRGELKALVWAMVLAQGALVSELETQDTLYLIDDLASEFDVEHRRRVGAYLVETGRQVMLTGVDSEVLAASCDGHIQRLFHVKQGQVEVQES